MTLMKVRSALILAGLMLAFTLAVVLADKTGYIGDETSKRAVQVAMGLIVVYCANLAPKALEPLSNGCEPARLQALQRFSGWTLVLAGLGYSLAWLIAPIEHAGVSSMAILGAGALLVAARCLWTFKGRERNQPRAEL